MAQKALPAERVQWVHGPFLTSLDLSPRIQPQTKDFPGP